MLTLAYDEDSLYQACPTELLFLTWPCHIIVSHSEDRKSSQANLFEHKLAGTLKIKTAIFALSLEKHFFLIKNRGRFVQSLCNAFHSLYYFFRIIFSKCLLYSVIKVSLSAPVQISIIYCVGSTFYRLGVAFEYLRMVFL